MRWPVKVNLDLPVSLHWFKLEDKEYERFNVSGEFKRQNYKRLYRVTIEGKQFWTELATPSLSQAIWSIFKLWNAKEGDPYNRHGHPVVMTSWANEPIVLNREQKRQVAKNANATHNKAKSKKK